MMPGIGTLITRGSIPLNGNMLDEPKTYPGIRLDLENYCWSTLVCLCRIPVALKIISTLAITSPI